VWDAGSVKISEKKFLIDKMPFSALQYIRMCVHEFVRFTAYMYNNDYNKI